MLEGCKETFDKAHAGLLFLKIDELDAAEDCGDEARVSLLELEIVELKSDADAAHKEMKTGKIKFQEQAPAVPSVNEEDDGADDADGSKMFDRFLRLVLDGNKIVVIDKFASEV